MNYILIERIVDTLVNTNLMFDEGIKKAWVYNSTIEGLYPNEKEIEIIHRLISWSTPSQLWSKTYKKPTGDEKYTLVENMSEKEKLVLNALKLLKFKQIYRFDHVFTIFEYDYETNINEIRNQPQLYYYDLFHNLEREVFYNINKLLEL